VVQLINGSQGVQQTGGVNCIWLMVWGKHPKWSVKLSLAGL